MHPARKVCRDGMTGIGQRRKESDLDEAKDRGTNGHHNMEEAIKFNCSVVPLNGSPMFASLTNRGVQELQSKTEGTYELFGLGIEAFSYLWINVEPQNGLQYQYTTL